MSCYRWPVTTQCLATYFFFAERKIERDRQTDRQTDRDRQTGKAGRGDGYEREKGAGWGGADRQIKRESERVRERKTENNEQREDGKRERERERERGLFLTSVAPAAQS